MAFVICQLLLVIVLSGCTGSAQINLVSLNMNAIDPPPPKVWQYNAQECYWWTDEDGDLNLAMKCKQRNLFLGKFGDFDMYMSFVLKEPPAGSGRDYTIRQRETRSIGIYAMHSFRLSSYSGIIDALTGDDKTYSGSFRIGMSTRAELSMFNLLPQKPGNVLCFGKYRAVHDAVKGREIRDLTEADGWGRPPKPARPTSQPSIYVQR